MDTDAVICKPERTNSAYQVYLWHLETRRTTPLVLRYTCALATLPTDILSLIISTKGACPSCSLILIKHSHGRLWTPSTVSLRRPRDEYARLRLQDNSKRGMQGAMYTTTLHLSLIREGDNLTRLEVQHNKQLVTGRVG